MPERREDAREGDQRQPGRRRSTTADAVTGPLRHVRAQQTARAVAEREELPERRHAPRDQVTSAEPDRHEDADPRDHRRAAGALAPAALAGDLIGADIAGSQERGEAGTAAHLQACDLGVGHVAARPQGAPPRDEPERAGNDAEQRAHAGDAAAGAPGEDADDQLHDGEDDELDDQQPGVVVRS